MTFSDPYHFTSNNSKMIQDNYNGRPIVSRIWSIERRHIQRPWTTLTPDFKVTSLFYAEIRDTDVVSMNRYLHTPCSTVLFRISSSDLEWLSEKCLMTRGITRSLCDSWATCWCEHCNLVTVHVCGLVWSLIKSTCTVFWFPLIMQYQQMRRKTFFFVIRFRT